MPIFPFYPNYYNNYYPHYRNNYYNKAFQNSNINTTNKNNKNNPNQEKNEIRLEEEQNGQEELIKPNKETKENRNYNNKANRKRTSKYNSFANINISAILESDINTPVVEILGIKLYLDDLIIIGLLFFLYKEDVQDEILFGILLMLLLS